MHLLDVSSGLSHLCENVGKLHIFRVRKAFLQGHFHCVARYNAQKQLYKSLDELKAYMCHSLDENHNIVLKLIKILRILLVLASLLPSMCYYPLYVLQYFHTSLVI